MLNSISSLRAIAFLVLSPILKTGSWCTCNLNSPPHKCFMKFNAGWKSNFGNKLGTGVLLLAMVLTYGCVASSSIKELKKDKPVSSERSVVFWKVRVTDKTGTLGQPGIETSPALYIHRLDVPNYGSSRRIFPHIENSLLENTNTQKGLKKSKGVYQYEQMMAISLDPGRYQIKRLSLYFDKKKIKRLGIYDKKTSFPFEVDRLLRVKPEKLYYIGSFNITIYEKSNGEPSYSFVIDYDNTGQEDMENFVKHFPDISSSLGGKPLINRPLQYFEYNFYYDPKGFQEFVRTDEVLAEINIEKKGGRSYIIQRFVEDENYHFFTAGRIHNMSKKDSFTIEWDSKWKEGGSNLPYGLLLGSSPQNAYFFSATGNRKNAVFLKTNNSWQNNLCGWKENLTQDESGRGVDHYKVKFSPDRIIYSVNNQKIAEFENLLQFNSFVVGLFVFGKETVIFDNIIIEQKPI